MKRKNYVAFVGAMSLFCIMLPACAKNSDVGTTHVKDSITQGETTSEDFVLVDMDSLTLKEKIETVLEDGSHLPEVQCFQQGEESWVRVNGELYCVGAVYPSEDWTFADVAASYIDQSAPWARGWYYGNRLWTSDYVHEFTVDYHTGNGHGDDWLYMDGYRVWPIGRRVGDISPDNMIQLYRAGEWDGKERIYSEECPALVIESINIAGGLVYSYDVQAMPEGTAKDAGALVRSWDYVYLNEYGREETKCNVFIHPDFPDPYDLCFADSYRSPRDSKGTYVSFIDCDYSKAWASCTGARVELYKQGEVIQSWDLTPEKDYWGSSDARLICSDDECYFFHHDTLWHLVDDGSIELMLQDIVGSDYFWDSTVEAFYTKSGEVVFIPPLSDWEMERLNQETENLGQ